MTAQFIAHRFYRTSHARDQPRRLVLGCIGLRVCDLSRDLPRLRLRRRNPGASLPAWASVPTSSRRPRFLTKDVGRQVPNDVRSRSSTRQRGQHRNQYAWRAAAAWRAAGCSPSRRRRCSLC